MKRELINDPRLTPTMEGVRNGSTQMFREKNPEDRTFISSENCDVSLIHEKRSMYSKLIDGEWYWVEGCAECNGEPRDWMTYVECDDHNRCRVCETKRKDLKDSSVWGGKKGWICNSCDQERKSEIRREAFEKFNEEEYSEWDFYATYKPKCPHCGSKICGEDMNTDEDVECEVCGGEVSVEVSYSKSFTTKIKGKRVLR